VRGVTSGDESLAEMKNSWLMGRSREADSEMQRSISIQMDNGGAKTVASRAFADHCKAPILRLDVPLKLQAFNKTVTVVEYYAVFVIKVTGIATVTPDLMTKTREFKVMALISDTEQPLILGSEVIEEQNIIFFPRTRKAIFFYNTTVNMIPWNEVKDKIESSTIQRSLKITDNNKNVQHALLEHFTLPINDKNLADMNNIPSSVKHKYDDVTVLIDDIRTNPQETMKQVKRPYLRWMIMALILFGMLLSNATLSYYTNQLRATVFDLGNKQSKDNASTSARIINHTDNSNYELNGGHISYGRKTNPRK
jgi:hypothetical protein